MQMHDARNDRLLLLARTRVETSHQKPCHDGGYVVQDGSAGSGTNPVVTLEE